MGPVGDEARGGGGETTQGLGLTPELEYGVRVLRLRDALDYASVARDLLDALIVDVARGALEISTVREEHRLGMLVRVVDRWLMLLDESARYLQKAREHLEALRTRGDDVETRGVRRG